MREGPARSTTESSGLLNCESLRPVSNMPVHEVVWLYLDEGETGRLSTLIKPVLPSADGSR